MTKPLTITLILHSTRSGNLGVGALTAAQVDILRRVSARAGRQLELVVVDFKDPRTPYVTGDDITIVDLDRAFMTRRDGYYALARRSDMVIDIGAGDSFADIYGASRLKQMFWLKGLTHLARTPLVLAPQTIGPFTKTWSRRLARASIKRCALVATRDDLSTRALGDLGYRGAVIEASDVALRLPYDPPAPRPEDGPLRVGLNVSGLLMQGGYQGKNDFGLSCDYPAMVRAVIGHFLSQSPGVEVHLVPHVIVPSGPMQMEDDYRASARLAEEFPDVILAPDFASPSEAKSYIAGMDFFAGARMHACIAALSTGVPVAPMAYSRKFAGLFGSMGYDHTIDCTALNTETVQDRVIALFERRADLAGETQRAHEAGLARLQRYEDGLLALVAQV